MDNIKQLEREVELLKEIIQLKERNMELEKTYIPQYPVYPYPIYPQTPVNPYPIITWTGSTADCNTIQ